MTDLSSLFPQGVGNITADNDISDNKLIRGDGGAKKAQESTISVSDDGEMVNTGQPCFHVYKSSPQYNITINTSVTITFDSERFDQGNDFTSNTFTAPVGGHYLFTTILVVDGMDKDANFYTISIATSNKNYARSYNPTCYAADFNNFSAGICVVADMDVNDTAYVTLYQSAGTAQADVWTSSLFSGVLIC